MESGHPYDHDAEPTAIEAAYGEQVIDEAQVAQELRRRLWAKRIARGRVRFHVYSVFIVLVSLTVVSLMVYQLGPNALPPRMIRVFLTILLLFYVDRGSRIARRIAAVLFGLGGFMSLSVMVQPSVPFGWNVILLVMQSLYLPVALELVLPTCVRDYLEMQRLLHEAEKEGA